MYITADASEETMLQEHFTGSGQDTFLPRSVESVDVKKTGLLYTKTPDTLKKGKEGRQRLLTFLNKVEANIAKEVSEREADIAAIRAQMAKNMEYNAAARKKMKAALLAKMAVNAKKAKDDLDAEMRKVQKKFADAADLENSRQAATLARSKKTRDIMLANKKQAQEELSNAVLNQQRALDTLAKATNERIKQTNKHIAINAAQIKENAKKAREDLENAMDKFDSKMRNCQEEAQKGRSKLAAQAAAQDKKFRMDASKKIKALAAKTAKEFADTRSTMAKDRAHADASLAHTTSRMNAALSAQQALQDKRFAQTVSDIEEAKKEANDRVAGFKTAFKTDILHLQGTVAEQTQHLNEEVTHLAGRVESNKLEQADINNHVNAELKRMVKVGNERYAEHLKKDAELRDLMAKNKADTENQIKEMKDQFEASITKIRDQMKKDREHAESSLSTATGDLYETLAKNQEAQDAINKELTDATRAAELDAKEALKDAKSHFATKIGELDSTVKANEKKHNKAIEDLTGVVHANAIKDEEGRAQLKKIADANKRDLKTAVADAIHKGEARALQVEEHAKNINEKTRADMNMKITTEISKLRKSIHSQIDELTLETKEARMEMRKEILYSLKEAQTAAKDNLKKAVTWAEGEFSKLNSALAEEESKSAEARAALEKQVADDKAAAQAHLDDAVAAQAAAVLSLKTQTHEDIKETNENLSLHAEQMRKDAAEVKAQMEANKEAIEASLQAAEESAKAQLEAVSAASAERYAEVVAAVSDGVKAATDKANKRFSDAHAKMADDREAVDAALAGHVTTLNKDIAMAAALEDARFSKTVKDLGAARRAAHEAVKSARGAMIAGLAEAVSEAKLVETKVIGMVQKVSMMIITDKAAQHKINKQIDSELARILKKSNNNFSSNKAARGVIKKIMDENKAAASEEVKNLAAEAKASIAKTRSFQAETLLGFKQDLTKATQTLNHALVEHETHRSAQNAAMHESLATAQASAAGALASAKDEFKSRMESLTNIVAANQKEFEENMEHATGVVMDWKAAADADRETIKASQRAMNNNLMKDIDRAIELGEAHAMRVEAEAMTNIETEKKALLTTITQSVDNMADQVFQVMQEDRQKIADNYLSLKAYSAAAADKIEDYLAKGKGRNLASIGDLLESVAQNSEIDTKAAVGIGSGADTLPTVFSGDTIKIDNSISKINGLVNEYIKTLGDVKSRWPMGLGKYLLSKLEIAMQKTGALEVDKIESKAGNYVFINAHAVGLSSKLSDFEGLAVKMTVYEQTLASLTGSLPETKNAAKPIKVPPPQWPGD